jgi:putative addiction module killer protein/probable addiction module antidote protein
MWMLAIARLRAGNFGKCRAVGEGVLESKIDFGPGIRIYCGIEGDIVVLLCGGDKSSQEFDIKQAKDFWRDRKERKRRR